jgi:hypothetical protein
VSVLGVLLAAALAVAVVFRRDWLPVVIGATAGLPYSVAVVVGGNGAPLFHVAGLVAVLLLIGTPALRTTHWTANLLVAFGVWAAVITALGPWMFRGIPVLSSRGGLDGQVLDPDTLAYTVSTFAQLGYLGIALLTVVYLIRTDGGRRAVRAAFVVGTVVSTVRSAFVAVGADRLEWLFDTNPTVPYSLIGPGDRVRGVFSEPSELAAFSVPAAVFFAVAAARSRGRTRAVWVLLCGLACVNLLQAGSGTAVAASAVVIGAAVVVLTVRYVVHGGAGTPWLVLGSIAVGIAALAGGPALWEPVAALVSDKVGSQSWNARTGGDEFSWGVAADTVWLGTGLGGNRPSSFAMSVLSCLGLPGFVLLALVLGGAVVAAFASGRPAVGAALLALVVAKTVGTPDLSTPVLWLLLSACLASAWRGSVASRPAGSAGPGQEARLAPVRPSLERRVPSGARRSPRPPVAGFVVHGVRSCTASASEGPQVLRLEEGHDVLRPVLLGRHRGSRGEATPRRGVRQGDHRARQRRRVEWVDEQSGPFVLEDLRRPARVRSDDRASGGHGLDDHLAERLRTWAGVHDGVTGRELARDVRDVSAEGDPFLQAEVGDRLAEVVGVPAVVVEQGAPDDAQPRIVGEASNRRAREGADDEVLALPRRETAEHAEHEGAVRRDGHRPDRGRAPDDRCPAAGPAERRAGRRRVGDPVRGEGTQRCAEHRPVHPRQVVAAGDVVDVCDDRDAGEAAGDRAVHVRLRGVRREHVDAAVEEDAAQGGGRPCRRRGCSDQGRCAPAGPGRTVPRRRGERDDDGLHAALGEERLERTVLTEHDDRVDPGRGPRHARHEEFGSGERRAVRHEGDAGQEVRACHASRVSSNISNVT